MVIWLATKIVDSQNSPMTVRNKIEKTGHAKEIPNERYISSEKKHQIIKRQALQKAKFSPIFALPLILTLFETLVLICFNISWLVNVASPTHRNYLK